MNIIVDIGNTIVKVAGFEEDTLLWVEMLEQKALVDFIGKKIKETIFSAGIISNVGSNDAILIKKLQEIFPFLLLDHNTKVPFSNHYSTPNTLGIDRIALVASAVSFYPKKDVLVIDAGTCITYDFVNSKNEYLGGAISPGIQLRYKSLNSFTAKLPLLELEDDFHLIGTTTNSAIHSGVVNGVLHEIQGVINQYSKNYPDLTVVLTGGYTKFLVKQLKNSIFANQNFLLYGLNRILTFNNL